MCNIIELLYGSEGCPLTERNTKILTCCDRRMLRYMVHVTREDGFRIEKVGGDAERKHSMCC